VTVSNGLNIVVYTTDVQNISMRLYCTVCFAAHSLGLWTSRALRYNVEERAQRGRLALVTMYVYLGGAGYTINSWILQYD